MRLSVAGLAAAVLLLFCGPGVLAQPAAKVHRIGINLLLADYSSAKAYLLYLGKRAWHERGIEVMPFADALKRLDELL